MNDELDTMFMKEVVKQWGYRPFYGDSWIHEKATSDMSAVDLFTAFENAFESYQRSITEENVLWNNMKRIIDKRKNEKEKS